MSATDLDVIHAGNSLAIPGVLSATGLVLPEDLPYTEWERIGGTLKRMEKSVQWWIGDWLRFGERKYGQMYSQALDGTNFSYGSLANMKYVAEHVESSRRRENVPFSHHQEVASLSPAVASPARRAASARACHAITARP